MNESSTLIEATQAAPGEAKGLSLNDTLNLSYGLFLAALGLHKVARLSSGRAWAVVLTFFCIRTLLSVSLAALFQT